MTEVNLYDESKCAGLKSFYQTLFPNYKVPDNEQWRRWMSLHSGEVLSYAIRQAAKKRDYIESTGDVMSYVHVLRFISSVANRRSEEIAMLV